MTALATDAIIAHQKQAEWFFAAAVFSNQEEARRLAGWLSPERLIDERVRRFWAAVLGGEEASKAALDAGIYLDVIPYMTADTFSSMHLPSFAEAIADDQFLVTVSEQVGKLAGAVVGRDLAKARELIHSLGQASPETGAAGFTAVDVACDFTEYVERGEARVSTGLGVLDRATGGLYRRDLTLIAARPSVGKSALALFMATRAAMAGRKVLYTSIEMSRNKLWGRLVCGALGIQMRDLWRLSPEQKEQLSAVNADLMNRLGDRLVIDDRSTVYVDDVWKMTARVRPDILFVDHLGLVASKTVNPVERLGQVSWAGKQIAKEFDCAVVMLSQLSRAAEARDNKRPTLSDLRDSGHLEQNSDTVIFIHRDDYYNNQATELSQTELILGKNRDGARNIVIRLMYDLRRQVFSEMVGGGGNGHV